MLNEIAKEILAAQVLSDFVERTRERRVVPIPHYGLLVGIERNEVIGVCCSGRVMIHGFGRCLEKDSCAPLPRARA